MLQISCPIYSLTPFSCNIFIPGLLIAQTLTYIAATWLLCIRVLVLYPSIRWLRVLVYGFLIVTHLVIIAVGIYALVYNPISYVQGNYSYIGKVDSIWSPTKAECCQQEPYTLFRLVQGADVAWIRHLYLVFLFSFL